jgi:hypothetical protein
VRRLLFALIISALCGCYAMSTLQEPHTLARGQVRLGPQLRVTQGKLNDANVRPAVDVQLRIGVRERLEAQLGATTGGGGHLGMKALLVDWPKFMLAIVPTYQIQYMVEDSDDVADEDFIPDYLVQTAIVPVIIGVPVASQLDLLFGADVHAGRRRVLNNWPAQSGPVLAFGGHVGLAIHTGGERATFVPQCGVLVGAVSEPVRAPESYGAEYVFDTLRQGSVRWECAIGVSIGARYANRTR